MVVAVDHAGADELPFFHDEDVEVAILFCYQCLDLFGGVLVGCGAVGQGLK